MEGQVTRKVACVADGIVREKEMFWRGATPERGVYSHGVSTCLFPFPLQSRLCHSKFAFAREPVTSYACQMSQMSQRNETVPVALGTGTWALVDGNALAAGCSEGRGSTCSPAEIPKPSAILSGQLHAVIKNKRNVM